MKDAISAYARGVMGEQAAAAFLLGRGMQLVCRRYKAGAGEIDLILTEGETLVFAEVKAREKAGTENAAHAVDRNKQRRLMDAACHFLAEHPEYESFVFRFDVVTVTAEGIRHFPNAFEPREINF